MCGALHYSIFRTKGYFLYSMQVLRNLNAGIMLFHSFIGMKKHSSEKTILFQCCRSFVCSSRQFPTILRRWGRIKTAISAAPKFSWLHVQLSLQKIMNSGSWSIKIISHSSKWYFGICTECIFYSACVFSTYYSSILSRTLRP